MIQITKHVETRSKLHHLMTRILASSCFFNCGHETEHVFKYMWPAVWLIKIFHDAPTKVTYSWLALGRSRSLRKLGEIHPSSMGVFFFRQPKLIVGRWRQIFPIVIFCLLEEEVEKNKNLWTCAHFTGSFHGICHVFASPMPSCESTMRHVEEASWNHFRWTHVNLWNKNAD